jgi:hypothetical protein
MFEKFPVDEIRFEAVESNPLLRLGGLGHRHASLAVRLLFSESKEKIPAIILVASKTS